ncbi:glycosyltransferase family 39 protein [Candidatus Peregrinibacteria bacterium]|nr:glycosyltransferase family 39 protein [Candidatus Peregrinibacteria bacterium]
MTRSRFWKKHAVFLSLLLLGAAIRVLYVMGTPHSVREHDVWGHIAYIGYVAENWEIPPPHGNSQFYHPPLYYFLTAPLVTLGKEMRWDNAQTLFSIQLVSLALSIGVLAIALWIGRMLIDEKHRKSFVLYGLIIATFPSLVFFAARINNDALYHFFAFAGLAFIIRYWKTHALRDWVAVAAIIGLGLLTKTHIVLLIPIAYACLLLQKRLSWRTKAQRLLLSLVIITLVGGWFHALRFRDEGGLRSTVLGNVEVLTNFVENGLPSYLTFNPVEIVHHPYNNPFQDKERRHYFWEYLYRSAFFGEYNLGAERQLLAITLLLTGMALGSLTVLTLWQEFRAHRLPHFPVLFTLVTVITAHVIYRVLYPYSSSQDFRYSILVLIPLAWAASMPVAREWPVLREARSTLITMLAALSTILLASLSL